MLKQDMTLQIIKQIDRCLWGKKESDWINER